MKLESRKRNRHASRIRIVSCLAITSLFVFTNTSSAIAGDWQVLFDGKSLEGWKVSGDKSQFQLVDGVIRASSSSKTQFLCTEDEYRDFELKLEVKLHDTDLNSGVQIRSKTTRTNDNGKTRASVHGPQVDLGKSPGRSGHVFGQGNGRWFTPEADLKRNSLMINGQWNTLRILAKGKTIQTWINGKSVANVTLDDEIDKKYSKGVIALQIHAVKTPEKIRTVSFRSIRIRKSTN